MKQEKQYEVVRSEIVYECPYYAVREEDILIGGKDTKYYIITKQPSAFIVAINKQNEVLLTRQFRYTTKVESIEIPAGGTDGEDALEAAKRELQEETGYIAQTWQHIGCVQAENGITDRFSDVFIANDLHDSGQHKMEDDHITETFFKSVKTVKKMIFDGEITDFGTIAAFFMAINYLEHSKNKND